VCYRAWNRILDDQFSVSHFSSAAFWRYNAAIDFEQFDCGAFYLRFGVQSVELLRWTH
jgi:hypothetical protein